MINSDSSGQSWFFFILQQIQKLQHPKKVSICRQYFDELHIQGFDFSHGLKCNDVHNCEKLNNFSIQIFQLKYYKESYGVYRNRIVPVKISKNNSDRVVDLLLYRNQYILIKTLHVFLGKHDFKFVGRRCLSFDSSQNVLMKHDQKCEQQKITANKTSIYLGRSTVIRTLYFLRYMQVLKLITKLIVLF